MMADGFSFAEALQPAQPKGFSFAEAMASPPPAADPVTDSEGHLIGNPAEALKSGAAFAQPAANIAEAGVKGAVEGFGHPMGQTILSPEAQDWMDAKQREGGVGGFLAGLGSTAAEDIGTVGGVLAGIPNAVFRGGQAAVAQTGAELGAPQLGRDIAAIPEAFMGSPSMLAKAPELSSGVLPTDRPYIPRSVAEGNLLLDYPRSPDVSVTARQIQARDGVGIMEAWNRAHTENNAAAIAKIGQATDIDGVIAAAGRAAEVPGGGSAIPAGWSVDDRFGPTPGVDATANPTGDVLGAGDLWRTDPGQLQDMLAEKSLSDRQKTVRALGSEAAAIEFYRLDRKQNSDLPWVADQGAKEFDAKFGNLTPEQERLIYGVGETGAQADDIQQVLDAHNNRTSDPTDAGYEAAIAIRGVPAAEIKAVPEGNASPMAQAAYVRLKNAYEDMRASGVAPEQVASTIAKALVDRGGWSPGDAAEVVGNFVEQMRQGAAAPAPAEASPYVRITSTQVQRRDGVGAVEASRRAAAENAAAAPPVPESVGAAASRDTTAMSLMPPETPAQKATALQKMVNQSADDRLTPQGRDDAVYVPGVERPEAMRDFAPAAEGELSSALSHKVLYNTDSNYRDQFEAQVKKNNQVMVDKLNDQFGDANSRDAAMNEAKELMPGPVGLFNGEKPVDAQPIADRIKEILAGPAGKRGAVESQLNSILPKLYAADGSLETLPSMLKGVRDDITDRLYDKSPTAEGNAARTARNQLRDVLGVVDDAIGSGLPGTKYQDYLTNLSAALAQVSKLDYLQRFLTGSRKITDVSGNLQFNKVQKLLEDIQLHHADATGGAKELSMAEINQIEAVRNELAAKDLLLKRASVPGSPTAQITNATGMLGSGPLGAGVKGAAEVALHAGLAATTGGVGNAALAGYRFIVKPAMDAAKVQKAAEALAATKHRLLDTSPRPGP